MYLPLISCEHQNGAKTDKEQECQDLWEPSLSKTRRFERQNFLPKAGQVGYALARAVKL